MACVPMFRLQGRAALLAFAALAAIGLSACQKNEANLRPGDELTTSSTAANVSLKETAEVGQRWQKDQTNVQLGLAYASRLKALGQNAQQLDVLRTLAQAQPNDQRILTIYGRELAEAGQYKAAQETLAKVIAGGSTDWKILSLMGSTLDQQGKYAEARGYYGQALGQSPDNISVLNNLGMSFALEGNLPKAEKTLRNASNLPKGKTQPRLRQNLALVVGLQGRFDEAREIASADLPPDEVEANMAYLQKMLSQPNTWQQLQDNPKS
jgi:Flp pilus assembly protein TadD